MAVKDICDEEFPSHTVGGFGNLCSVNLYYFMDYIVYYQVMQKNKPKSTAFIHVIKQYCELPWLHVLLQ